MQPSIGLFVGLELRSDDISQMNRWHNLQHVSKEGLQLHCCRDCHLAVTFPLAY